MYPVELGKVQRRSEGDILRLTEAPQKVLVTIWPDFIVKPGTPNDDNAWRGLSISRSFDDGRHWEDPIMSPETGVINCCALGFLQWLRNSPSARNLVSFRSTLAS
jgi:hypothetical protein